MLPVSVIGVRPAALQQAVLAEVPERVHPGLPHIGIGLEIEARAEERPGVAERRGPLGAVVQQRVGAAAALVGGLVAWWLWVRPYAQDGVQYSVLVLAAYVLAMGVTVATCGLARLLLDDISALEAERTKQARETVHRIKNLIAVVQAIAFKVSRRSETQEAFQRDFGNQGGHGRRPR